MAAIAGTEEDQIEAVNVLYQIRNAAATDDTTAAEQKRNLILNSELNADQKADLYYHVVADKDTREWIDSLAVNDPEADVVDTLMRFQNASGSADQRV